MRGKSSNHANDMNESGLIELDDLTVREKREVMRQAERRLYKEDKLYLALQIIRGFFPGIAVIAFLEAYYGITALQEHSLKVGFVFGAVSIAVWIWVENYRARRFREVLPGVIESVREDSACSPETSGDPS